MEVVGMKEKFVIRLVKRMLGLDKGAYCSKMEVSDVPNLDFEVEA